MSFRLILLLSLALYDVRTVSCSGKKVNSQLSLRVETLRHMFSTKVGRIHVMRNSFGCRRTKAVRLIDKAEP